jgi:hypothetical protein
MMLLALVPWWGRALAIAALAVSLFGYGWIKGAEHGERKLDAFKALNDKAVGAQIIKAAQATADLRIDYEAQQEVFDAKYKRIIATRDANISELRIRAERRTVPAGDTRSCDGANGSELARPDAGFLEGYAADTAIQQEERNRCIAAYGKVKAILDALRKTGKVSGH